MNFKFVYFTAITPWLEMNQREKVSEKSINKSEISDLNKKHSFIVFTWLLYTLIHTHCSLPPKLHSRRKYVNILRVKDGSKGCKELSTWKKISLNCFYLTRQFSPLTLQWRQKINFITKQHFQSQPCKLFNTRAEFPWVFYDWSTLIPLWWF